MSERVVWTYYVSRDTFDGKLADTCNIWWEKPERRTCGNHVTWCPRVFQQPCHFGRYMLDEVRRLYRVAPDTDLELIRIEQYASAKMLAEAQQQVQQ